MTRGNAPAFERGAWNGRGALSLFLVAEVAFIVVGAMVALYINDGGRWADIARFLAAYRPFHIGSVALSPFSVFAAVLARTVAALALILGFRRWLSPSASPAAFGFTRPAVGMLFLGMLAGIFLIVIDTLVTSLQIRFVGSYPNPWTTIMAAHHGTAAYLLDVSSGALITPVAEELIFRGLLFTALVQRTPLWVAVVASSALFSAAHFQVYAFPALFVIGAGQALLYYRARNIWVTISAHAVVNFVLFSLLFLAHA